MCLLTFFPEGQQPDVSALYNGAFVNDDGHGWAIVAGDRLLIGHGLKSERVIEDFMVARAANPDGPAMFHSRFTTHGLTNLENCHPFYVGADRRTVLAHNGVLPTNVQPRKGDPRSDTRIAAESYIPSLGSLKNRRTRIRVEKWMGDWNKMCILTVNPRYRERAYLLNEEAGTWHDGIWYSNEGYKPFTSSRYGFQCGTKGTTQVKAASFQYWDECRVCEGIIDVEDDVCPYCNTCLDCTQRADECLCYRPMVLASSSETGLGWPEAGE